MYKICIVTTVSMTLKAFVLELAKAMTQSGDFEVHFVCDHDEEFGASLPENIHYHPIAMKRGISLGGFRAVWEMYRLFRKEKFDLVQYSTPNAACYASIAARLAGIRVRLYCQWGIAYVGFQGLKRRIFKLIEKMVCVNSTMIQPDSYGNLRFCQKEKLYTSGKSRVIWNGSAAGVDFDKFDVNRKDAWAKAIRERFQIPGDAKVFVFVGRLNRDKGINELFTAARRLLREHEDAWLLLVGSPEINDSIDPQLCRWSQEEPRVVYAGFTNEVEKYIAASDVYVLPSYREGFGVSTIESEAMGIPVIVTDIPGPTEAMVKDSTGLVVKKADADELFAAMEKLYGSGALRGEMGRRGLEFVSERFERKRLFEKILADRRDLLRGREH